MLMYSTHGFGDVGSREACEKQGNFYNLTSQDQKNSYMLLNLNVSSTPVIMRFGLCMPSACNQAQLDSVFSQVSESLTIGLQNLLKVYNPGLYFLPGDVSIQVQIQKTEEYEQTWYSRIDVGTVIVCVLIVLIIITLLVFTFYNCVKMRIPQKVNKVQVQQSIAKFDSTMDQTYFTPRNNFNNINHTTLQMSQTSSSNQLIQTQNNEIVQQPPIIPISKLQMILQSFSLQKSFAQIHQYRQPIDGIKDMSDLNMFDGFRVLVLIWVLLLGTCQYTMSSAVYNPWRLQDYFQTIAYTAVYSANLGFDEFFMISAFFTTFKVLQVIQKSESKTLTFKQYLNLVLYRYLRLAPLYYLVFLFGWLIGPHMGSGPCWLTYEKGYSDCSHYWWSVFTMTLNFFPSYVIANEGLLAIYKLQTFKKRAFALTLLLLLGIGIIFLVIWVNKMAAGLFAPQDKDIFRVFVNKPYTKIHSVAIGISLGFIFEELNRQKMEEGPQGFFKSLDRNKLLIVFSQLAAWGLIAFVSLYPLEANKEPTKWSNLHNSLFISLSRPIFLICLCCQA
eukprot:403370301